MKFTLRVRIISLITLFTVILIGAFTALLLTRQLEVITQNNRYRARLGSFVAKRDFERALITSIQAGDPAAAFQKLIPLLQKGQLAEEAMIVDPAGKVVAAGTAYRVGRTLEPAELTAVERAVRSYNPKKWFESRVTPEKITFHIPITIDEVPQYVAIMDYSLGNMGQAIREVGLLCFLAALAVILAVVPLCLALIRAILGPIQLLGDATRDIAGGNLQRQVTVPTEDELGDLAGTFNNMAKSLAEMKAKAENANPLTKLPGNNMIHEQIEKRLQSGKKFVAVYSDLDNFKAFNDKYGIGAGDQAIKLTAEISKEAIKKGAIGDFLGHEGGDDFFILTTPAKAQAVTDYLCQEFDKQVRKFYSEEDQKLGKIVSKDREGNLKEFPIMTISLAGVTNAHRELKTYAEITNICAEVKKMAKKLSKETGKSSFYLDQRTGDRSEGTEQKETPETTPDSPPASEPTPPPAPPPAPPTPPPTPAA